ncbi:WXG100 family type VII secretion target [Kitasatospora viridis]|uniref:ESAT-6-like protein n=1 Tax=Kitasatospora viridis TaxID=281105 RepID=A0A561UE81_9ACTN|nr:WXG100 family type VII secretion target [Kitasatospora viridis]TWF97661.1 early secretory antigenic target protein ESAT-6 [Kitasatospora viridis]
MSDGHIKVTFETIQNAGAAVRGGATTIQGQLDELRAKVVAICGTWTGAAQEGYNQRQAVWDSKAKDLHETLLKIAGALDDAHAHYTATEAANAGIWHA